MCSAKALRKPRRAAKGPEEREKAGAQAKAGVKSGVPSSSPAKLREYRWKRDFQKTAEPAGKSRASRSACRRFVVQKHAARSLHFDFRLELDGVLKSWAIPKGPSLDPSKKRLAVHVEDHPLEYADFEGVIPPGEYGGGTVLLWDRGQWTPRGDAAKDYDRGRLKFELKGRKLRGGWMLLRMKDKDDVRDGKNWLLVKERDAFAKSGPAGNIAARETASVTTGRTLEEVAERKSKTWKSNRVAKRPPTKRVVAKRKAQSASGAGKRAPITPESLPGAHKRTMPTTLRPQLATLVKAVPEGDQWLHELKFDGYRMLCFLGDGRPRLITRHGNDWSDKFKPIVKAVSDVPIREAILDGEVVVQKADGSTDFQALQNVLEGKHNKDLLYYVFDLPYCDGCDLTATPLVERKRRLRALFGESGAVGRLRYSDHIQGNGPEVFRKACGLGLEGIVSKRADSPYVQKRTHTWTKSKCVHRQEFVIGGFTDPGGARTGFGALLVGYYDSGGRLVYCGRVGTGFDERLLASLFKQLKAREIGASPFANLPAGRGTKGVHWIRPELVAEVEFASWTNEGILRHPSFQGLRADKHPKDVRRETPQPPPDAGPQPEHSPHPAMPPARRRTTDSNSSTDGPIAGVTLTNPDRVLYPEQDITKRELALFYESIADWILPHVIKRPLSLVRCPRGTGGHCFYQKHVTEAMPAPIRGVAIREKKGVEDYIVIDDLSGLITLVQLGVLEFHPWGCREDNVERPDRMVFDLDPGPSVEWLGVVHAAVALRDRLEDLGLQSFVKTSGGKGLHVVVPLQRRGAWDEMKDFSAAIAESLARLEPARYLTTATKAKRHGRIFIDYLRNGRGATSVAAYSTRAREGAPVSTPIAWDELTAELGPAAFTVKNLPDRLARLKRDPWDKFLELRQSITATMTRKIQSS